MKSSLKKTYPLFIIIAMLLFLQLTGNINSIKKNKSCIEIKRISYAIKKSDRQLSEGDFTETNLPGIIQSDKIGTTANVFFRIKFRIHEIPDEDLFLYSFDFGALKGYSINDSPARLVQNINAGQSISHVWKSTPVQINRNYLKAGENIITVELLYLKNLNEGTRSSIYIGDYREIHDLAEIKRNIATHIFHLGIFFCLLFLVFTLIMFSITGQKKFVLMTVFLLLLIAKILFHFKANLPIEIELKIIRIMSGILWIIITETIFKLLYRNHCTETKIMTGILAANLMILFLPVSYNVLHNSSLTIFFLSNVFILYAAVRNRKREEYYFYTTIIFIITRILGAVLFRYMIRIEINTEIIHYAARGVADILLFSLIVSREFVTYIQSVYRKRIYAEASNKTKSLFLANMSHEIRTPLHGIMGLIQIMKNTPLSKEQTEYVDMMDSSSQNLLAIINDILDLSKIEAGKMQLDEKEFRFKDLVQTISATFRINAEEKGLELFLNMDDRIPEVLISDAVKLSQIIINITGNAIKFTEQGRIEILISIKETLPTSIVLEFSIKDTGIGIPKEKHSEVFNYFSQADRSIQSSFGGTGLGLTITKNIIELMQGTIHFESEPERGSNFIFILPFRLCEERASLNSKGQLKDEEAALKILVAEDDLVSQRVIKRMLESRGHEVILADNGKEIISFFRKEKFDCILMDEHMPEMNGIETTLRIRKLESETGGHIPIIAFSADIVEESRKRYLEAGMDGCIPKPVDFDVFFRELHSITSKYK